MSISLTPSRKRNRMSGLVLAITLSLTASVGLVVPNRANAWVASEFTQVLNNVSLLTNQLQDYYRYADDAMKWKSQLEEMQKQIAQLQNAALTLGLRPGQDLTPVPLDKNVAERCGGFNLSALTQVFNINGSGDIYQQQKQVCANIQRMENTKYNLTVEYLREYQDRVKDEFKAVSDKAKESKNAGDLVKPMQDALLASQSQKNMTDDYNNRIQSYNSYIDVMRNNQKLLGQIALKGSRTNQVLGQLGRTAILEAALSD